MRREVVIQRTLLVWLESCARLIRLMWRKEGEIFLKALGFVVMRLKVECFHESLIAGSLQTMWEAEKAGLSVTGFVCAQHRNWDFVNVVEEDTGGLVELAVGKAEVEFGDAIMGYCH